MSRVAPLTPRAPCKRWLRAIGQSYYAGGPLGALRASTHAKYARLRYKILCCWWSQEARIVENKDVHPRRYLLYLSISFAIPSIFPIVSMVLTFYVAIFSVWFYIFSYSCPYSLSLTSTFYRLVWVPPDIYFIDWLKIPFRILVLIRYTQSLVCFSLVMKTAMTVCIRSENHIKKNPPTHSLFPELQAWISTFLINVILSYPLVAVFALFSIERKLASGKFLALLQCRQSL